jgi:hypothetical protein
MTTLPYVELYTHMHSENQLAFIGATCVRYADIIAELVNRVKPTRMLDYGCGKGAQYLRHRIHEKWGGLLPDCYDPGVPYLSKRPKGKYQGIICCDVLEHIEVADVPEILADVFSLADVEAPAFVFMSIACRPSKHRTLPDGRNVHLTVQPPQWWDNVIMPYSRANLTIVATYDSGEETEEPT